MYLSKAKKKKKEGGKVEDKEIGVTSFENRKKSFVNDFMLNFL